MCHPRRFVCAFLISLLLILSAAAAAERPPHFSYPTKLINVETGYLLSAESGRTKIGFGESGYGVSERVQLTTNTMLDAFSFLNAEVKLGLLFEERGRPAVAIGGGYYYLVAASYAAERIAKEVLSTEDELELDAGMDSWYLHISASKHLHENVRFHVSYQYRYISGHFDSDKPITLTSGDEELSVVASLDQSVYQRAFMSALDADISNRAKLILELGYDSSYERVRGGAAIRLAATERFAIQVGILWPGIDLGDDFELPVIPNFTLFWRY
jgi:hypothetical protein